MANIDKIAQELEQGVKTLFTSDKYKEYLNCMGKFYNYSFNNTVLIYCQMPTATLVAGYNAWQSKFKRQVKKGEKAIKILAPCPHKKVVEREQPDGSKESKEINWTTYRAVNVFDVSQTEGQDLPSVVTKLDGCMERYPELFQALCEASPVPVEIEDIPGTPNGYYSHAEKRIAVRKGMSQAQTIKTLVHEITHAMLHDKERGNKVDRGTGEVQAESVAYVVCNALGLDTSEYSFGYVAGWSEGQDLKELTASMDIIRKTAKEILDKVA